MATYFCTQDGVVLNVVAGPVDAKTFLREARWVVETRKAAIAEMRGNFKRYAAYFKNAHAERFLNESGAETPNWRTHPVASRVPAQRPMHLPTQTQVQWLLASRPAPKLTDIYRTVYQDILNERVSNLPVTEQ